MPRPAGKRKALVRFERRPATAGDGYGNSEGPWQVLIDRRRCELRPTRGTEQVIAARLQGVSSWDLWIPRDVAVADVREGDRVVEIHAPARTFNIRFIGDVDGDNRQLLMQLELGSAV